MSAISVDAIKRMLTPDALRESAQRLESCVSPGLEGILNGGARATFSLPLSPQMTVSNARFGPVAVLLDAPSAFAKEGEHPKFIDLGCGCGRPSLEASSRGWKSIGVDIDLGSVETAKDLSKQAVAEGFIKPELEPIFLHNNFYPDGFERKYPEGFDPKALFLVNGATRVDHEMATCKVARANYEAAGVGLDRIDLFYHYQLESLENLLLFFSRYAKVGGVFALVVSSAQGADRNVFDPVKFPNVEDISSAVAQCHDGEDDPGVMLFFKHEQ